MEFAKEKSVKDKINFCIVSCKYIKKSYILILKAEYDIYVQTYLATFILDVDKQRFPYLVSLILRDSQYETFWLIYLFLQESGQN